jgi:heme A synthase
MAKPIIHKMMQFIHRTLIAYLLLIIFGLTKKPIDTGAMRKCIVLFLIFVVALFFASVAEKKETKWNEDWKEMVVKK